MCDVATFQFITFVEGSDGFRPAVCPYHSHGRGIIVKTDPLGMKRCRGTVGEVSTAGRGTSIQLFLDGEHVYMTKSGGGSSTTALSSPVKTNLFLVTIVKTGTHSKTTRMGTRPMFILRTRQGRSQSGPAPRREKTGLDNAHGRNGRWPWRHK